MDTSLIEALSKQVPPHWVFALLAFYILANKTGVIRYFLSARVDVSRALTENQARLMSALGNDNKALRLRLDECEQAEERHEIAIRELQVSEQRLRLLLRELVEYADARCSQLQGLGAPVPPFAGLAWFLARGGRRDEIGVSSAGQWLN